MRGIPGFPIWVVLSDLDSFANFGMAGSEGGEPLQLRAMLQQADAALLEAKRTAQTSLDMRYGTQ
jgi:hypothetical protein